MWFNLCNLYNVYGFFVRNLLYCCRVNKMQPYYYSFHEYVQSRFGEKLYKLSLETGCTCPTRDGTLGTDGCIFCSAGGSGEFAQKPLDNIHLQIERAKAQVSKKFKGTHYIAYFQSYTNTYGDIARLRQIYFTAAENPCVKAVSIATRPDCLPPEVLQMLKELNEIKPIFVELGLQTVHESTAQFIHRGYPLPVYEQAVSDLHGIGVHVVTHLILGLPQETKEQMLESVRYVGKIGTNGVKLQLLHVLKGTDLEKIYRSGAFQTLEKEEYIDLLCDCIEVLPQNTVIHRLTGDAPKALLVAPTWSSNKKDVLNSVHRAFLARDIRQGKKAL